MGFQGKILEGLFATANLWDTPTLKHGKFQTIEFDVYTIVCIYLAVYIIDMYKFMLMHVISSYKL